ncbi:phosphoenolpyruvate carboxykinase (ATP) [Methanomethylophilus alvi]|uniref:hypothetical protein n=1 Tax=Methanomethylophilus alvi TaxID=1291540 RepID=UPI000340AFFA|nr:hypothetical protein [Methanomethylophilus alvi]MDD7479752.1 hypothetical protein [Methanomethylophilus alvi]MDY7060889.1 hypothetical protein [Methanomethylophilus alvi]CDF31398.1 putative uncharacterized protein [Methanoculleus sp. CAG:1088]
MPYETELISENECKSFRDRYDEEGLFSAKADINGITVQLFTSDRDHIDMWRDNFYAASDRVRAHARLYCITDKEEPESKLYFEPATCTAFLFNFDYYGWVKSIALGIAGYILEGTHDTYSVHGAAIDVDDVGVTLIAPSKTGKTTQSWGLLRADNSSLISDDWYFVTFGNGRPKVTGSEKNCYIDADIGDVWEEYKPLVKNVKFDNKGRGIANVRWVTGESSVSQGCSLRYVILLQRNTFEKEVVQKIDSHRALEYLMSADLCNPHQIVRDPFRSTLRANFFKKLFEQCEVYMVNTTGTPQETQAAIRKIVGVE